MKTYISFEDTPSAWEVFDSPEFCDYVGDIDYDEKYDTTVIDISDKKVARQIVRELKRLGYDSEVLYDA